MASQCDVSAHCGATLSLQQYLQYLAECFGLLFEEIWHYETDPSNSIDTCHLNFSLKYLGGVHVREDIVYTFHQK